MTEAELIERYTPRHTGTRRRTRRRLILLPKEEDESLSYSVMVWGEPCSYCGSTDHPQLDHIDPSSRGGESHWENYAATCRACNASKRNRNLIEFLMDGGMGRRAIGGAPTRHPQFLKSHQTSRDAVPNLSRDVPLVSLATRAPARSRRGRGRGRTTAVPRLFTVDHSAHAHR